MATMIPKLFTGRRQAIFELMLTRPGINAMTILNELYKDDPDGGPNDTSTIRCHIYNMKPTLRKNGYEIDSKAGKHGGYTLRTQEPA